MPRHRSSKYKTEHGRKGGRKKPFRNIDAETRLTETRLTETQALDILRREEKILADG